MKTLKWINTGAFVLMLAVNALANLLPIGGYTTGQISEIYPNLFTPAPVTFSIWGLIYALMLAFILYQLGLFDDGVHSAKLSENIGFWFAASCMLNTVWILLWHNRMIGWSTVCIALLLIVLSVILSRLNDENGLLLMITKAGFSLYFGWIIAATIANVSVFLTTIGWNGWGLSPDFWTVVVLLTGAGIASAVVLVGKNRIAAIAVMWAYMGILIRHISSNYYGCAHPFVIAAGFLSEIIILVALLMPMLKILCPKPTAPA